MKKRTILFAATFLLLTTHALAKPSDIPPAQATAETTAQPTPIQPAPATTETIAQPTPIQPAPATTETTAQPTPIQPAPATTETIQNTPVDAINLPDTESTDTSPIVDVDAAADNESVFIDPRLKAVPKTDHDEDTHYHYTIDVTYPQLSGDPLSPAAQQFNQIISKMVNAEVEKFKNSVKLDAVHMNTLPEEIRKNSFKIDYDIDVIKPDSQTSLISVRLSIEGMQAGRAHPFHAHQVLNFDLTHGKALALSDLFKKNAPYLTVIAAYSRDQLNKTLQDKWLIADGTKPDPKNYKNWNLEADSLLITFDEYQVAPYVDGPQEIEIPLAELAKLIAANAPVMAEYKTSMLSHPNKTVAKTQTKKPSAMAANKASKNKKTTNTLG